MEKWRLLEEALPTDKKKERWLEEELAHDRGWVDDRGWSGGGEHSKQIGTLRCRENKAKFQPNSNTFLYTSKNIFGLSFSFKFLPRHFRQAAASISRWDQKEFFLFYLSPPPRPPPPIPSLLPFSPSTSPEVAIFPSSPLPLLMRSRDLRCAQGILPESFPFKKNLQGIGRGGGEGGEGGRGRRGGEGGRGRRGGEGGKLWRQ